MKVASHYDGEAGAAYSAWQLGSVDALAVEVARRFSPFLKSTDTCLDFGCGGGNVLSSLAVGRRLGVEPNEASRRVAEGRGIKTVASLDEVTAESVDVVISNHALEHCLNPYDELVGMRGALRIGGTMVLVLPLDDWRRSRQFKRSDVNHHLYAWTPLLIGNLVSEAGLVVESVKIVRHAYPPGVGILWRLLPETLFDTVCQVWSVLAHMRQILVVAHRTS